MEPQTQIHPLPPATVNEWLSRENVLLVDVREPSERDLERIEKSSSMPFTVFHPGTLPQGKTLIFYCQYGKRSQQAAMKWREATGSQEAYYLEGGLEAWKAARFPTASDQQAKAVLLRRAKLWSGGVIVAGTLLSIFVSTYFLIIPLCMGALLLLEGWQDRCFVAEWVARFLTKK